jgi:hypothetical protein
MAMKKFFYIFFLVFLFSCQSTKITHTWTAKNLVAKKYKKVLVLGLMTDKDNDLQVKMENHLADELRGKGYLAIAANKIFPAGTFIKGDTARGLAAIEGKGFDAIFTIVLLDKNKEPYFVPGKITDYSNYNKYSLFDKYYNTVNDRIYSTGYYGEETKYIWENNFYDLDAKKMIYSARTRSFDFVSKNTLAHTYGLLMANSLISKNILLKPADE